MKRDVLHSIALGLGLAASLLAASLPAQAQNGDTFGAMPAILPPTEAFVPTVTAESRETLRIDYAISEGTYLYKDKLHQRSDDLDSIGEAVMPTGTLVNDEYFGEKEIYRDSLSYTVPIRAGSAGTGGDAIQLELEFQGCADIGICYPPTTTTVEVSLPPLAANADSIPGRSSGAAGGLKSLLGASRPAGGSDTLLAPQDAFVPAVVDATPDRIAVQWTIPDGYYLYRDKLHYTLSGAGNAAIATATHGEGITHSDEYFGDVVIFRGSADATLGVTEAMPAGQATLDIEFQGCADIGVCYPPTTTSLPVMVIAAAGGSGTPAGGTPAITGAVGNVAPAAATVAATAATSSTAARTSTAGDSPLAMSEQDRLAAQLANRSLWLNTLIFFGLGLLLALTPCVYPMVPILSSLIVGHGETITTGRALKLSVAYVIAMALTYAVLGVLVGLSGYNIQAWFQNPWILSAFAGIFVLLSLSMFGFYELQLPQGIQQRLNGWSNNQQSGSLTGVAIMGVLSALVVSPCVTPPLVGALIYIANTGDGLVGGSALFALGLGMGAPLLLIGASAGHWMPRAGAWMEFTKRLFGILLLAMAIWMLSRFLDPLYVMLMSAVLALISGVYLGATDHLDKDSSGWHRLGKGVGILASLYGVLLFVGAMAGNTSFRAPLKGIGGGPAVVADAAHEELQFMQVASLPELQSVVASAQSNGKAVMLDFYADWCVSCKEMEAFTFSDPTVIARLSEVVLVQADVTANDAQHQELLRHFNLFGPPAIIFYDHSGTELAPARVVGYMPPGEFSAHIDRAIGT